MEAGVGRVGGSSGGFEELALVDALLDTDVEWSTGVGAE